MAAANLRDGNTEQIDLATQSWIRRETARSRVRIDLNGNYGKLSDEKTEDSFRTNLKWDIYWSRNFYITALNFEGYRDEFQNIERRLTPSAGFGYHVLRGKKEVELEFLAGFQTTQFASVGEGIFHIAVSGGPSTGPAPRRSRHDLFSQGVNGAPRPMTLGKETVGQHGPKI